MNSVIFLRYRGADVAFAVVLVALTIFPREITLIPAPVPADLGLGIARSGIAVSPYGLVIAVFAAICAVYVAAVPRRRSVPSAAVLLAILLPLVVLANWGFDVLRLSGVLHWLLAVAALFVGSWLGARSLTSSRGRTLLAFAILFIVTIELVVCLAQRAGIPLNPMDAETAELMGVRTNGTMGHPANLGKNLLLIAILALGVLPASEPRTRRVLTLAVALMLIPLGLSQGRANIAAVVGGLVIWSLWAQRSSFRRPWIVRLAVPLAVAIVAAPFVGVVAARFEEDPSGGARSELTPVALRQIADAPLLGTGPNAYLLVVSEYDRLADIGYPVHNAVLLSVAELGVPLGLLVWIAVGSVYIGAWRNRNDPTVGGDLSRSLLAFAPGLAVVVLTGWGMLLLSLLPLWWFVLGAVYGVNSAERARSPEQARARSSRSKDVTPRTHRAHRRGQSLTVK